MTGPDSERLTLIEVLPEPGLPQVWVSTDSGQTHRIDLSPLLQLEAFRILRLSRIRQQVRIAPDQRHLRWPGGVQLDARSIVTAPAGTLPVLPVSIVAYTQRYRPLSGYLHALQPMIYLHPDPVEPRVVCALLGLDQTEFQTMLTNYRAPTEVAINRLYDLGTFLNDLFPKTHLHALLRRAWPYAIRACPGESLLHTMLGCLHFGRPDLIERPCLLLASGYV